MTPPAAAAEVFGARLPLAEAFATWLVGPGIARGLIGPREADQIWARHLLNGVAIAELIGPGSVVVDLGSGAGLPGIPLLLARPDLDLVLVEPKERRTEFLVEVCADLGLRARVVRARATPTGLVQLPEGSPGALVPAADVVTARAVASIADLARWAAPLLRPGGRLLAVKGSTAHEELVRDRPILDRLGFKRPEVVSLGSAIYPAGPDGAPTATTVIAMSWGHVSRET